MSRFANLELDGFQDDENSRVVRVEENRDERYYLRLATEAYQIAQFDKALRFYSRTLEYNPNLVEGWVGQVRMLIELNELSEALLWARKALDLFKDEALILAALAHTHVRLVKLHEAVSYSDAAVNLPAEHEYIWLVRGEVLLPQGRQGVRNADFCFMRAKSISRGHWFVRLLIARIYFYYRRFAEALEYATEALEDAARNPFAWTVRGQCLAALKMNTRAGQAFRQAIALDEKFEPAHLALRHLRHPGPVGRLFEFFRRPHGK